MEKISDALIACGVKRTVALVVDVLSDYEPHSMRDIEKKADLRQPEVSIAVTILSSFLSDKEIPVSPGRGRPLKIVQMSDRGLKEYVNRLVKKKEEEIAGVEEGLKKLKEFKFK